MPLGSIYDTGTVAVVNGSATVVGADVFWPDVLEGDHLVIGGLLSLIASVDTGANSITLMKPYAGASNGAATYQIAKMSWLRYDPSIVMYQVRALLSKISDSNTSLIYYTVGTPDPAIGENGDIAIDATASPWQFWLKVSGVWVPQASTLSQRVRVAAAVNLYVSPTGSDANDGLTVGTPFQTIQKATNYAFQTYDMAQFDLFINLANGTYTETTIELPFIASANPLSSATQGCVIKGNTTTPASVVVNGQMRTRGAGPSWYVTGMKFTGSQPYCVYANNGGRIRIGKVEFGAKSGAGAHVGAEFGGIVEFFENYTINGNAQYHGFARMGGIVKNEVAVATLTGTPAFSGSFVRAETGAGIDWAGGSFSGAATGARHFVAVNSYIFTNGGNPASFFPGNAAGTVTAATFGTFT